MRNRLIFTLILLWLPLSAAAQTALVALDGSRIWVDGDSNQSAWTLNAKEFQFRVELDGTTPTGAEVTVPVRELDGGKGIIMNRLVVGALKADEAPTITFNLDSATATDAENVWRMSGVLTIADSTRSVQFDVTQAEENGHVRYTGSYATKMSDFGVERPSLGFGSFRTADDVTIHFDILAGHEE